MSENGYPVRGWLIGLKDGTADLDEVEDVINKFIEISYHKGYEKGVKDTWERDGKAPLSRANEKVDIVVQDESEGA